MEGCSSGPCLAWGPSSQGRFQEFHYDIFSSISHITSLAKWYVIVHLLSCVQLLCNPVDWSSPGSSVHGISQARILEWVAMPFSRASSRPRDQTCVSCIGRQILHCWATREAHWLNGLTVCKIKLFEEGDVFIWDPEHEYRLTHWQ